MIVEVFVQWTAAAAAEEEEEHENEKTSGISTSQSPSRSLKTVKIPVFKTQERREVLFEAEVAVDNDIFDAVWLQRRVCLIASTRFV